jgi:hypothetical protein
MRCGIAWVAAHLLQLASFVLPERSPTWCRRSHGSVTP